jgi:flavin-dependent dehydrogenase
MFFSDTSECEFKRCGSREEFIDSLKMTKHIWSKLYDELNQNPKVETSVTPMSFLTKPAATTWAHRIQGPGWVAIGDSAMTFDPLSSQGIYTALCSAEKAVDQIVTLDQREMLSAEIVNSAYIEWAESIFNTYVDERTQYYGTEQRWPESNFWACRQSC